MSRSVLSGLKTPGEGEGSRFKPTQRESLNGFKIFDIDQLILALIFRLGLKNWTLSLAVCRLLIRY